MDAASSHVLKRQPKDFVIDDLQAFQETLDNKTMMVCKFVTVTEPVVARLVVMFCQRLGFWSPFAFSSLWEFVSERGIDKLFPSFDGGNSIRKILLKMEKNGLVIQRRTQSKRSVTDEDEWCVTEKFIDAADDILCIPPRFYHAVSPA